MKRNEELVKATLITDWSGGINQSVNLVPTSNGAITKRKGYNTFGEMVDVLWKINKQNKKMKFKSEYTITLPLKGTKPIYKKTLQK